MTNYFRDLTIEEAKKHLRVYHDEDDKQIEMYIKISQNLMDGLVGTNYYYNSKDVEMSKLLQLMYVADMYENSNSFITSDIQKNKMAMNILHLLSLSKPQE